MKDFNAAVAFIPHREEVPPRFRPLTESLLVVLVGLTVAGQLVKAARIALC